MTDHILFKYYKVNVLVYFVCSIADLLPNKFTFRTLKKGFQELYRKFVLAPADKAANNVVIV